MADDASDSSAKSGGDEFNFESNFALSRYPLHDCCEFEDAESLRKLIFVRQDDSDDEDDSSSSSSSSLSSSSSDDDDLSSSEGTESHAASNAASERTSPHTCQSQTPAGSSTLAGAAVADAAAGQAENNKENAASNLDKEQSQEDNHEVAVANGAVPNSLSVNETDVSQEGKSVATDRTEFSAVTPSTVDSKEDDTKTKDGSTTLEEKRENHLGSSNVNNASQLLSSAASTTEEKGESTKVERTCSTTAIDENEPRSPEVSARSTGPPNDTGQTEPLQMLTMSSQTGHKSEHFREEQIADNAATRNNKEIDSIEPGGAPIRSASSAPVNALMAPTSCNLASCKVDAAQSMERKIESKTSTNSVVAMDVSPVALPSHQSDKKPSTAAAEAPGESDTMSAEEPRKAQEREAGVNLDPASPRRTENSKGHRKSAKKKRKKSAKAVKEPTYYCPYDLNERDEDENTPLHVAIHARKLEHVRLLLEAGASVHKKCDGSAPIHTAISIGAVPNHADFAYECVKVLTEHGADLSVKDDSQHAPLYLACMMNQPRVVSQLLSDPVGIGTLNLRADRVGGRALHAAAKFDVPVRGGMRNASGPGGAATRSSAAHGHHHPHGSVMHRGHHHHPGFHRSHVGPMHSHHPQPAKTGNEGSVQHQRQGENISSQSTTTAILAQVLLAMPGIEVDPQNNYGRTPLHIASKHGNWPVVRLLLHSGANPHIIDRRGYTPGQLAHKRGMVIPNDLLPTLGQAPTSCQGTTARDLIIDPDSSTVILCHELCSRHRSCPPIVRGNSLAGAEIPPENVRRLHVLINEDDGILRCGEFGGCSWETETRRAAMVDILKVHEYGYVEKISRICASIPDHPSAIAHLDADTAVSRWSFEAAMRAAGSVCEAVDKVMSGDVRNAFCAVRPPGHHAGPRGIVKCPNDLEGSHGFCLFNNVAIGAAYARSMYRNDGIRKVAIIDFDVHHGNGTEEIVRQLVPNVELSPVRTPFAVGSLQTSKYRPWLDENDIHDVFFASSHGYGPRNLQFEHPQIGEWFYPASGKTGTTDAILNPSNVENPNLADFILSQSWTRMGEESRANCCKIINCGLALPKPGDTPGMQRVELRDAYRKNILPRLIDFDPDMIFVSAGFDAHKRDTMNFGYVGMIEDDYEWITEQLIKVANSCCNGRIVSVLEGGYKIHGGIVSPFARSVASHVRALVDGGSSRELYDAHEGDWESQFERHMVEEKEKKRQMKIERLNRFQEIQRRQFHNTRHQGVSAEERHHAQPHDGHSDVDSMLKEPLNDHNSGQLSVNSSSNDVMHHDGSHYPKVDAAPTRKRRRNQVDYKELYEQMKKEGLAG